MWLYDSLILLLHIAQGTTRPVIGASLLLLRWNNFILDYVSIGMNKLFEVFVSQVCMKYLQQENRNAQCEIN